MSGLRILAVIANLVPYHVARWTAVADAGHQVMVLQRRAGDPFAVLATQVEHPPFQLITLTAPTDGGLSWQQQLSDWISRFQPQVVVINGYIFPEGLSALLSATIRAVPVVICSESNWHDAPRRPWSEVLKRRIIRLCHSGFVGGELQASYLETLGLAPQSIFRGYNAVDNSHFASVEESRQVFASQRSTLGLPNRYLLAVSRFTLKKNLVGLIEGYAKWRDSAPTQHHDLSLLILGDGPMRTDLEAVVSAHNLQEHVFLPGSCSYEDLPIRYTLAEAFIHASSIEQWGLVVNEAMAAGLPVLVSGSCGCVAELVQNGVTGKSFNPTQPESIAASIRWLLSLSPNLRVQIGQAARRRVSSYGTDTFAIGLESASLHAIIQPPIQLSLFDRLLLQSMIKAVSSQI